MSEKLAEEIDKAVKAIIDRAYETAKRRIRNNRAAMDHLVDGLLEKETLTGDEFRAILSKFTVTARGEDGMRPAATELAAL